MDAAKYDVKAGDGSFLSTDGFARAVSLIMRIRPGGLMFSAPPCCAWVWISKSTHKRTRLQPAGDPYSLWVLNANCIAARLAMLILLCVVRRVYWVVEAPKSSLLFCYPPMQMVMGLQHPQLQTQLYHVWWHL